MADTTASTPAPPYWAVIFTTVRSGDDHEYAETDARLTARARAQPGFLGIDSTSTGRVGITVSYWADEQSIRAWRDDLEHEAARRLGRERWYDAYELRVARVDRAVSYSRSASRNEAIDDRSSPAASTNRSTDP